MGDLFFGIRHGASPGIRIAASADALVETLHGRTMGTSWSAKFAARACADLDKVRDAIERVLATIVVQMSQWEPDSDLSRWNRAQAGSWHLLPDEFREVLHRAVALARDSGGAFDPTLGPLVESWGFGPAQRRSEPPCDAAIRAAQAAVGWQRLVFDDSGRRLLQPGGMRLDLSGIAKGYAVDRMADALKACGIDDCLVEIGGELLGRGARPDGAPWRVAIDPPGPRDGRRPVVIALRDRAIATSGDDWHAFDDQGLRYSHTLDARSGRPIAHALASVSVVHAQCIEADALATALTVMGPDEGMAYARRHGLAVQFVSRTATGYHSVCSEAFARLMSGGEVAGGEATATAVAPLSRSSGAARA